MGAPERAQPHGLSELRALYIGAAAEAERRVTRVLGVEGITCVPTCVRSPAELIDALQDERPWDLLIGEHALESLSFMQALRIIAARDCEPPAILLDGAIGEQAVADALQAGAAAYVSTGDPARLAPAITVALEKTAASRERARAADNAQSMASWLISAAPDAIIIIDAHGEIVVANDRAVELFGYTSEELLGQPVEMLVPERSRAGHVALRDAYAHDPQIRGMGVESDLLARTREGREIPVAITLSPVPTPSGTLVSASIRDNTARMQAAEALRLAEERFRGAFEEAPIGMALVALDGCCLSANRALCEIVGYDEDELHGLSFQQITHREDLGTEREHIKRMMRGEIRSYKLVKRYIHKEGRLIWVDLSVELVDGSAFLLNASGYESEVLIDKGRDLGRGHFSQADVKLTMSVNMIARTRSSVPAPTRPSLTSRATSVRGTYRPKALRPSSMALNDCARLWTSRKTPPDSGTT